MSASCDHEVTSTACLVLPEELTVYHVSQLREDWLAWLARTASTVRVDGAGVSQVDGAGIQLLAALLRTLDTRQVAWQLQAGEGALREALHIFGLDGWLTSGNATEAATAGA